MSANGLSDGDRAELMRLETALWQRQTRFDRIFMEAVLADDFVEYGRSGRRYERQEVLSEPEQPLACELPLGDLHVRPLATGVAQVTYVSRVIHDGAVEVGRRSSIWSRTAAGDWVLRFHQGTPIPDTVN